MTDKTKAKILLDDPKVLEDTLENLTANLGTSCDKRETTFFRNKIRLSQEGGKVRLDTLYQINWLAGKVVDIIPDDMTRKWRSFKGDIEPDVVELLEAEERRLQIRKTFNRAHKWGRLYGTAYVVMNIDDGQEPDKPVDMKRVKKGSLKYMHAVERSLMIADITSIEKSPLQKNYGLPNHYIFTSEVTVRIHHSRILRFEGNEIPFEIFRENNYNSDSVLDRLYDSILNSNILQNSAASMVFEANVNIVKVEGLMQLLQTPEGTLQLQKRFGLAAQMMSFNNMLLLGANEEFSTKHNTFTGIPELQQKALDVLVAGSDVPATRLLGDSASGMSATGDGDERNYFDMISAKQVNVYGPHLDYVDPIMAISLGLPDGADLKYKFNPLFQMTQEQQADLDLKLSQMDKIYLELDVVTRSIIAKRLQRDDTYPDLTDEFIDELEKDEASGFTNFSAETIEPIQETQETATTANGAQSENAGSAIQKGATNANAET